MAKPIINNYEDLLEEQLRLKQNLQLAKAQIRESFAGIKDELNPFAALKGTAKKTLAASSANPLVKFGITRLTDLVVGKILLKNAGWMPRMAIPFLVRAAAGRMVANKPDKKIASILRTVATKIRNAEMPNLSKKTKG